MVVPESALLPPNYVEISPSVGPETSGKAVASHLHYGVAGKSGPITLPLCVPCASSPSHGVYKGPYVATAAFVKAILHGGMYANIHTM